MLKIETEKIVIRGEKYRRVVSVAGVMEDKILPAEYLKGKPRITREGTLNQCHVRFANARVIVESGKRCTEKFWEEELLPAIREAGERLHVLRQEEKKLKETWKGTETFVI